MLDYKLTRRREELAQEIKTAKDRETAAGLCNEWYGVVFEQYKNCLHMARFIANLEENDSRPEVRRILRDSSQHMLEKAEEVAKSLNQFTLYQLEGDIPFYFSKWG